VPAPLQLLVHLVQEHVRQKRRQGSALRRSLVPLDHHAISEHARVEVAANEPEHATVRDPLSQPSHQHVVVHTIEKFFQIDVHDIATTVLHVTLSAAHGVVRPSARPEAVTRLREGGIETRLQDLQQGLLDEPVEHRRDAKLALASAGLRNRDPPHRLWLVAFRDKLFAQTRPVHLEEGGQFLHRHPVDAGTSLVLPNTFQRGQKVRSFDDLLHQTDRCSLHSWTLVSTPRQRRFHTRGDARGFTACAVRAPELLRLLWHCASESRGRFALPIVRSFTGEHPGYYDLC